eukprot:261628_1
MAPISPLQDRFNHHTVLVSLNNNIITFNTTSAKRETILGALGVTEQNIIDAYNKDPNKEGKMITSLRNVDGRDWIFLIHHYVCNVCFGIAKPLCAGCGAAACDKHQHKQNSEYYCARCAD